MDEARVIPLHGLRSGLAPAPRPPAGRPPPRARPSPWAAAAVVPLNAPPVAPEPEPLAPVPSTTPRPAWDLRLGEGLSFLRRRLSRRLRGRRVRLRPELTETVLLFPALRPLYERWFRVEVNGVENIPSEGGALLVANHAGGLWPLDAAMTAVAVHDEHPAGRFLRMLGADLLFAHAGARRRSPASPAHAGLPRGRRAAAVLRRARRGLAGGIQRDRQAVPPSGTSCSASAAAASCHAAFDRGVPIIPVSIVGSEEIHPVLGNAKVLARLLDLPYFPITPTFPWLGPLGLVPLPSKWYIEFGEPIQTENYGPDAADDPSSSSTSPTGCAKRSRPRSTGCSSSAGRSGAEPAQQRGSAPPGSTAAGPAPRPPQVGPFTLLAPHGQPGRDPAADGAEAESGRECRPAPPCGRCGSRGSPSRAPWPRPAAPSRG